MATVKNVPVTAYKTVLELDEDETKVLVDILANVGGDPETSRRGTADRIFIALRDAGNRHTILDNKDYSGSIHFR